MDALKAEIASKRKALQEEPLLAHRPTKYMRRGDVERLRQEYEQNAQEERRKLEEAERKQTSDTHNEPKVTRVSFFLFRLACFQG
jgi:pre-mRNA-splicing factor 18